MNDFISRQAAIDALADMHCKSDEDGYVWIVRSDAWARIDALPSAEPEIIRCKDCKYAQLTYDGDCKFCLKVTDEDDIPMTVYYDGDHYCGFAERREE